LEILSEELELKSGAVGKGNREVNNGVHQAWLAIVERWQNDPIVAV
jgi:hypothetical protein